MAKFLKTCKVKATPITDQIPDSEFRFVVVDEDRVFSSNYCEIICAARVARRLAGYDIGKMNPKIGQ